MNILRLPREIQEKILLYVGGGTEINRVCSLWYKFSKESYLQKKIVPCICRSSFENIQNCRASSHFCVCGENDLKYAMFCKGHIHPCVCDVGLDFMRVCKSDNHPCLCNKSSNHALNCRGDNHPCICKKDFVHSPFACQYAREHPCICIKSPIHALNCRGKNHPCICLGGSNYAIYCKSENHFCICVPGRNSLGLNCRAH